MILFEIDARLEKDSLFIADLALSRLYLKNDKENPWFVLVPRKINATELIDLNLEEQCLLMKELSLVSNFLKLNNRPFKINIGALGNIVRQLHIHIIARYESDRAWPDGLWGTSPKEFFTPIELENIKSNFIKFST